MIFKQLDCALFHYLTTNPSFMYENVFVISN